MLMGFSFLLSVAQKRQPTTGGSYILTRTVDRVSHSNGLSAAPNTRGFHEEDLAGYDDVRGAAAGRRSASGRHAVESGAAGGTRLQQLGRVLSWHPRWLWLGPCEFRFRSGSLP